jgi:protein-S-isoprenylcysteine O-methyltransferase Ste14
VLVVAPKQISRRLPHEAFFQRHLLFWLALRRPKAAKVRYNARMTTAKDNPGVIAPPPLIATITVVFGLLLDRTMPVQMLAAQLSFPERIIAGGFVALAGAVLAITAERRFKAVGTNVPPWKPALHLATTGIYERMRNPMYVGLLLLTGGIGIALASDWTLTLLIPMALVLHYGVVLREERYLEAKFGDEYRRYKARVPRWGIL